MTDERWIEIKALIEDKFEILNALVEATGDDGGTVEIIEFISPMGKIRLERTNRPLVIDKKVIGSKRIGSEHKVQFVYSDTEKVHTFKAYRWNNESNSWIEMEMEKGAFFL